MTDMAKTGPLALVTGVSSGIGLELAKQLVAHEYDLLLNAEDAGLGAVAVQLASSGVGVQPILADLRITDGIDQCDFASVAAFAEAFSGLSWVLRERRLVPAEVERGCGY